MNSITLHQPIALPKPAPIATLAQGVANSRPDKASGVMSTAYEARPVRISRHAEESALYAYHRHHEAPANMRAGQHIDEFV